MKYYPYYLSINDTKHPYIHHEVEVTYGNHKPMSLSEARAIISYLRMNVAQDWQKKKMKIDAYI